MIIVGNFVLDLIVHFAFLYLIALFLRVTILDRSMMFISAAAVGALLITTLNHTLFPNMRLKYVVE
jgi:hypothetical protein